MIALNYRFSFPREYLTRQVFPNQNWVRMYRCMKNPLLHITERRKPIISCCQKYNCDIYSLYREKNRRSCCKSLTSPFKNIIADKLLGYFIIFIFKEFLKIFFFLLCHTYFPAPYTLCRLIVQGFMYIITGNKLNFLSIGISTFRVFSSNSVIRGVFFHSTFVWKHPLNKI